MSDPYRASTALSNRTGFALSVLALGALSLGCQRNQACQEQLQRAETALNSKAVAEAQKLAEAAAVPCGESEELAAFQTKLSAAADDARLAIKEDQWKRDRIMSDLAALWEDVDSTPPAKLDKEAVEAARLKALEIGANPPERFKSHVEQSIRVQYEKRRRLTAGEASADEVDEAEVRYTLALQKQKSRTHAP